MKYDVVIIGAGPGGIFSAYELMKQNDKISKLLFLKREIHWTKGIVLLMVIK